MSWRERLLRPGEREQVALRVRELLDQAHEPVTAAGGWVPASFEPIRRPTEWAEPEPIDLERSWEAPFRPDSDRSGSVPGRRRVAGRRWAELLSGVRVDPGRRGVAAVAVVVVLISVVGAGVVLQSRPRTSAVPTAVTSEVVRPTPGAPAAPLVAASGVDRTAGATGASSSPGASTSAGGVVVDVAGQVTAPGVYRLPAGSRVEDALRAAGGVVPGADVSTLNRARKLVDGEQLAVGVPGAAVGPAGGPAGSPSAAVGGKVDLNAADLTALETLPGVGPVTAQHILDWRTEHGHFSTIDELRDVSGIGPVKFDAIRDAVTV